MSPADAAKLLDLPTDASPEQVEVRFLQLQGKLEEKIARAPTDGLKAKYRDALIRAGEACDTLLTTSPTDLLPTRTRLPATARATMPAPAPIVADPAASNAPSRPRSGAKPALPLSISLVLFTFCAALPLLLPLVYWRHLEIAPPEHHYRADLSVGTYLARWRTAHYLGLAAMLIVSAWLFRHAAGPARSGWRAVLLLGLAGVVLGEGLVFLILMSGFNNVYGSYAARDSRFASALGFLVLAMFVSGTILAYLLRKITPSPKPVRWWLREILWGGIGGALAALAGLTFDFYGSSFDYDNPAPIRSSDIPIVHFTYFAGLMISVLALFFGVRWLWCHAPERARPY